MDEPVSVSNLISPSGSSGIPQIHADLAGINVLDTDRDENNLALADLDPQLNVKMITIDELATRLSENGLLHILGGDIE